VARPPSRATGWLGWPAQQYSQLLPLLSPLSTYNVIMNKDKTTPSRNLHRQEPDPPPPPHPQNVHVQPEQGLDLNPKAGKMSLPSVGQDVSSHCWSHAPARFLDKCRVTKEPVAPSSLKEYVSSLPWIAFAKGYVYEWVHF